VVLSHAHIDHSGRLPKLVKDGFSGDIISTHATRDLCSIMLMDSASIQEQDARWERKRNQGKNIEPLYTVEDAELTMEMFFGVPYNRWYRLCENVHVLFKDAGHILGSASVTLKIVDEDQEVLIGFTGDIGRPDRPILKDPVAMQTVDYLICESTYGGKTHEEQPDNENRFLEIIQSTCIEKHGKLLIPAFSVGRTQEIVYMLDRLSTSGKLPKIPVYVDSPLAVNATQIFIAHPECYDVDLLKYMIDDPNPFGFNDLHYVRSVEQSKHINDIKGPAIVISASGMMSAGRIRHHIHNHIGEESTTLLIVGFCAPGTLGAELRTRPDSIRLFGKTLQVKASIEIMDSFSGHADQPEILEYLSFMNARKVKQVFLVHGERDRQLPLKSALEEQGFASVMLPELGESVALNWQ
jgi:metallo-beta-lactamase family protein